MDIELWLNNLDLSEYIHVFKEESIDMAVLPELSSDDLKEIGITKLGHRKIILKAISELKKEPNNKTLNDTQEKDELTILCKLLPKVISSPLSEYISENNAFMKLWFACDTAELLIRFLVIIGLSDLRDQNKLSDQILKQFWGKIEMPTLGAWMAMAKILLETKDKSGLLVPEIHEFVSGPLTNLLYGSEKPGTPETSFLALRNRLAHGGGLNNKEASRLLNIWQERFENCLNRLDWIKEIKMYGIKSGSFIELIEGQNNDLIENNLKNKNIDMTSDSVLIMRNNNVLNLWPLLLFGSPQLPSTKDNINKDPITQIYVRKDVVRLQFTPIDVDGYSQTEKGEDAIDAFKSLFGLDRQKTDIKEQFQVPDFTREINRDASQMVGRFEEQNKIEECIKSINDGLIWVTGTAGIGKSFLAARLMSDLSEKYKNTSTFILPYRFKVGDNARCNRDSFTTFIIERIIAADKILDAEKISDKGTAVDKLKSCFNNLKQEKKLIIVLDGLDEINVRDKDFAKDFPASLKYPGIIWVCIGRPEPALVNLFKTKNALIPFPEGLPPMSSNDIRGMILEKIGPLKKKLLSNDKESGETIVNPFIDLVAKQADGLPLYVKYVIGDVLANRYRVLDGDEVLPDSLHAYHEQLLEGLGIGDLKFILTPLASLLAVAFEPLSLEEIQIIFIYRKIISNDEKGKILIENGLSAIAPMLRRAPDPEGEEGYTLFHYSLREHILKSQDMANSVQTAKEAFCELAMKPDDQEELTNYLYRTGIDHFIDLRKFKIAGKALLNFYWLLNLFNLGKTPSDINGYWSKLPISSRQIDACYISELINHKNHIGFDKLSFGLGHDWVGFMQNEIYNGKIDSSLDGDEKLMTFELNRNEATELDTKILNEEKNIIEANLLSALKTDDSDFLSESDEEMKKLVEDMFEVNKDFPKEPIYKNFNDWCVGEKRAYEWFEPMETTEIRLSFYYKLSDFFLLSRLCHSGVELSARICRLVFYKFGGTNTKSLMALDRLSSFYGLWDGQAADNKYNEKHLFFDPKYKGNVYGQHEVVTKTLSRIAPSIFHYCLKFIVDEYGLTSPLLPKLLLNPCAMLPDVKNLNININSNKKPLMTISDVLFEVSDLFLKSKREKHPSSLDIKLSLANRLYFEMKLRDAKLIIDIVYNDLLSLYGLNDERTLRALETKGNIEFELGNFKAARISFMQLIKDINKKYSNELTINEWRSKLVIIELAFQNFEVVEDLCSKGLVFFNNPKTDKFLSISGDRIFIIIRDLLNELNAGLSSLSGQTDENDIESIILSYVEKGLHEMSLYLLNDQNDPKFLKKQEILKLIRSFSLPLIFTDNINYLFDQMTPREQRCVRMRYGIGMNTTHSLDEIAKQFDVTAEEIKNYISKGFMSIKV